MCVSVSADQFVYNFSILSHQAASAVNFTLILFLSKAQLPPSHRHLLPTPTSNNLCHHRPLPLLTETFKSLDHKDIY